MKIRVLFLLVSLGIVSASEHSSKLSAYESKWRKHRVRFIQREKSYS